MVGRGNSTLVGRMVRASMLDVSLYEEVEADREALGQALTVVLLASLASGIAGAIGALMAGRGIGGALLGLIGGIIAALVGWFIWSFLTYWIGTHLMGGTATYGELLRTIGFSDSPGVLAIFGFIPCIGPLVALVASIWSLVAMVVAVRQALDFTTGKAVVTVIVGFVVLLIIYAIFGALGLGAAFLTGSLGGQ